MTLKIGTTDISSYIAFNGFKWTRNDVDGVNAGRALNGLMIRDRVATKDKLEITCRPLTSSELSTLLALIEPETVTATYNSPRGSQVTKTMYSNNVPASFYWDEDGGLWTGVTFPLVEV